MKEFTVYAEVRIRIPINVSSDNPRDAIVKAEEVALKLYQNDAIHMNDTDDFIDPEDWEVVEN